MRSSTMILLLISLAFAGCVKPDVQYQALPALEPFNADEPYWLTTKPVLLVADCQLINLYSKPVPERNLSAAQVAETAIRSPQLCLFSSDVVRWILSDEAERTEAILHLGDAIDLACEGEFRTFLGVMAQAGRPWLLAPGNHECFYFGSYDPVHPELWEDACFRSQGRLPKDRFIRLYVAALVRQLGPGFDELAASLGLAGDRDADIAELAGRIPIAHEWKRAADSSALLKEIVWNIDEKEPWRSFVLQRADLSGRGLRMDAILMDSCQYTHRPALMPNAWQSYPVEFNCGYTGELLADQLRIIRDWVDQPEDPNQFFTLMCHHPLRGIGLKSRASLFWLTRLHRTVSLFVTAHTHDGHYDYFQLGEGRDVLELNLGSAIDWPMEWRDLQVFVRDEPRQVYVRSNRYTLVEELRNRAGYFEKGWEVPLGAADDYRRYRIGEGSSGTIADFALAHHLTPPIFGQPRLTAREPARQTEAEVKNTALLTYERLIRTFPTDVAGGGAEWPEGCRSDDEVVERIERVSARDVAFEAKVDFLIELARFERTRRTRDRITGESLDEARARFKLSQAVWASRFQSTGGRRLRPEDTLIRVQRPRGERAKRDASQPK